MTPACTPHASATLAKHICHPVRPKRVLCQPECSDASQPSELALCQLPAAGRLLALPGARPVAMPCPAPGFASLCPLRDSALHMPARSGDGHASVACTYPLLCLPSILNCSFRGDCPARATLWHCRVAMRAACVWHAPVRDWECTFRAHRLGARSRSNPHGGMETLATPCWSRAVLVLCLLSRLHAGC